ncbi:MAG: pseudoazurin [Pseudomonadota bacterium]
MKLTRRENLALMGAAAVTAAAGTARAEAKTIEVQMLNVHPEEKRERQVFYPAVVRANVGDTIKFISVDKGHNATTHDDMVPDGGETWKSKINDDFEITLTADGTYGYFCTPHQTVGMVGLILVGDAMVNFEDARGVRQRGKAKARYEAYFAEAEEMLAGEA